LSDPDVIKLLTEIRDLQRQHTEEYRQYLARYEATAAQQAARATRAIRVALLAMLLIGGLLGVCVAYLALRLVNCPAFSG
jgi:hypothetical protein